MAEARITKPRRMNLTAQCLRSIRQYIVENDLDPGDRLPSQHEWAEMLGVSVLVVREAFQALQALGLVEVQHGRGIFVRGVEEADFLNFLAFRHPLEHFTLEEVIEARAMLELTVLEACIMRATPEQIRTLEELLDILRQHPPQPGVESAQHVLFHQTMLEVAGSRLLSTIGMPLLNTFWALGNAGGIQYIQEAQDVDMVEVHAAYVRAIKARDLRHTRELVDQHLLGLCSAYHVFPFVGELQKAPKAPF